MNSNPIKVPRSEIARRFAAYRRNMRIGAVAVVSLSTLRALSAVESRQAEQLTRSIVARGRTDDGGTAIALPEGDTAPARVARSFTLTPGERAAIDAARPGSRSVIFRAAPVAADDEPLPADFTPAPVADYSPILLSRADPEVAALEVAAEIEAGIEVAALEKWDRDCAAAVAFVSDYAEPAPVDYAPGVVRVAAPVAVAPVAPSPMSEHAALLAAIMGNAKPRHVTFRA